MEEKTMGLSKNEKIMFSIIGIVLLLAIGVLIINIFSQNERELDETPVNEVDVYEEETDSDDEESKDTLKESSSSVSYVVNNTYNTQSKKVAKTTTKATTTVEKEENKEDNEETLEWDFNSNIVTEAYSNEEIIIDNTVLFSDGTIEEASVIVRKLEDNVYNLVDITNNRFVATEGTYIYYYTHNNVTKELVLNVYNKLNIEDLTIREFDSEESIFSEEEFNNLLVNDSNASLSNEDGYILSLVKKVDYDKVALKLTISNDASNLSTGSDGVEVLDTEYDLENNLSYITLLIDTTVFSDDNTKIILSIDDVNYAFDLRVNVTEEIDDSKDEESDEEENKEDIEQTEQKGQEDDSDTSNGEDEEETNSLDDTLNEQIEEESELEDESILEASESLQVLIE